MVMYEQKRSILRYPCQYRIRERGPGVQFIDSYRRARDRKLNSDVIGK